MIVARGLGRLGTPLTTGGLGLRAAVVVARIRVGGVWPPQRQQQLKQPERELPQVRDIILRRQDDEDIVLVLATLIADDQLE